MNWGSLEERSGVLKFEARKNDIPRIFFIANSSDEIMAVVVTTGTGVAHDTIMVLIPIRAHSLSVHLLVTRTWTYPEVSRNSRGIIEKARGRRPAADALDEDARPDRVRDRTKLGLPRAVLAPGLAGPRRPAGERRRQPCPHLGRHLVRLHLGELLFLVLFFWF